MTICVIHRVYFFFFNDTATTEIYTLSLHDALPIWRCSGGQGKAGHAVGHVLDHVEFAGSTFQAVVLLDQRSEEHTSELQSRPHLVCRLLLEKKKKQIDFRFGKTSSQRSKINSGAAQ